MTDLGNLLLSYLLISLTSGVYVVYTYYLPALELVASSATINNHKILGSIVVFVLGIVIAPIIMMLLFASTETDKKIIENFASGLSKD